MSTVLVTGASGFIGSALAGSLQDRHTVLRMGRNPPSGDPTWVRGDFGSFEDLRQLDNTKIDVVIHLAAVTGGCLERDGILVNVAGTRCLMRYLMDRGCRKFVMASSIAVIGIQSTRCRPQQVPIPDEHPCLDSDAYGFSKHLMEEVTRYYHRQNPAIDVINLRLAAIGSDDEMPEPVKPGPLGEWALAQVTMMALSDAVRAFSMAAEAPYKAGVRTMNAAPPKAWVGAPVADILKGWWGGDVDVSYYESDGRRHDSVYDVSRIKREIGFVAKKVPAVA